MKDLIKKKQLKEIIEGLRYIASCNNAEAVLEIGKNNCKYLLEEIERLNNIINKAIEYIEHCQTFSTRKPYVNGDDLLDILKGADKEVKIVKPTIDKEKLEGAFNDKTDYTNIL